MARTIVYRVKTPAGAWQRAVIDDDALPQSITSGIVGGETYEVDTGRGTLVDITPEAAFTLETFTGTPVAEGSGVFRIDFTSPAYLAAYDFGEVEGAGTARYTIPDDLATGPIVLYPGTVNAASYEDGDVITAGNLPFGVGSQVPSIFYRVYSDTPSPNTEVFDGATLNFDTSGREGEELRVVSYMTDDNGESAEATIGTFTIAAGFSPAELFAASEPGIWLEISPTYCFTDTARTTNAAVGDAVAAVEDRSGNGNHAIQGTLANRPILRQSGSLYYLEFDGSNDILTVAAASLYAAGAASLFAGLRSDNVTEEYIFTEGSSASNNQFYSLFRRGPSDTFRHFIRNNTNTELVNSALNSGSPAVNGTSVNVATALDTGSTLQVRVNASGGSAAGYTRSGTLTLNKTGIGGLSRTTDSSWNGMDLYGLIVVGRTVTTGERDDAEAWIAAKSGVTL